MHILISHRYSPRLIREIVRSLTGSAMSSYSSKKIDDVELPPEPTSCCMSGCTNCVWVGYAEELVKLYQGNSEKVREIILNKVKDPNLKMFLRVELKYIQYKESLQE